NRRGRPSGTAVSVVSDVRSDRWRCSSTKYGPSVSDGVTTQDRVSGVGVGLRVAVAVGAAVRVAVGGLGIVAVPGGILVGVLPPESEPDPPPQPNTVANPNAPSKPSVSRRLSN